MVSLLFKSVPNDFLPSPVIMSGTPEGARDEEFIYDIIFK